MVRHARNTSKVTQSRNDAADYRVFCVCFSSKRFILKTNTKRYDVGCCIIFVHTVRSSLQRTFSLTRKKFLHADPGVTPTYPPDNTVQVTHFNFVCFTTRDHNRQLLGISFRNTSRFFCEPTCPPSPSPGEEIPEGCWTRCWPC